MYSTYRISAKLLRYGMLYKSTCLLAHEHDKPTKETLSGVGVCILLRRDANIFSWVVLSTLGLLGSA